MNKALFLDRDGIINVDHGYVYKQSEFEFVPGILICVFMLLSTIILLLLSLISQVLAEVNIQS
jgi:histidinol phosphatase-like enzyme